MGYKLWARRNFMKVTLLSSGASLFPFSFSSKDKFFVATYTTIFPKKMTPEQWQSLKQRATKSSEIKRHTQMALKSGELIRQETVFQETHSQWILTFKDKKSFLKWESEVIGSKHRSRLSSLGFRFKEQFRYNAKV
ncbi:MAG: hypothetical protein AAF203_04315 [Pseudomonadota bacterium]